MPPQLVALSEGPNILLDKPILLVGRHQECDIQLASRKISRRHCCIAQVNDYLVVRDLGSTNGVRINGVRVQEGSLRTGDELAIGNQRYQLKWQEDGDNQPALGRPADDAESLKDMNLESMDEPMALPDRRKEPPVSLPDEPSQIPDGQHDRRKESASLSDIVPPAPKAAKEPPAPKDPQP